MKLGHYVARPSVGEKPDLPHGYEGDFELWTNDETGEAFFCLNVFSNNDAGRACFLRCFYGEYTWNCEDQFAEWIGGLYNSRLFG